MRFSIVIMFVSASVHAKQQSFKPNDKNQTICGEKDDREPSAHPYVARLLKKADGDKACTGSLVGKNCVITAGHCTVSGYGRSIEFNTPPSKDGEIVHAAIEDRYLMIKDSLKFENNGRGQDWAVFKVNKNKETGLYPSEAQAGAFGIRYEDPEEGQVLQILGYGVDDEGSRRFAQQSHVGNLVEIDEGDSRLKYQVDTTGGNSGSGVLDQVNQTIIGVHTHGGCRVSLGETGNFGTSIAYNQEFKNAVLSCLEEE